MTAVQGADPLTVRVMGAFRKNSTLSP